MLRLFKICFLFCSFTVGFSSSCLSNPPSPPTGKGIGVTFLRTSELMKTVRDKRVPLNAEVIFQNLSRYDAIWHSQTILSRKYSAWSLLRKRSPEKLMLLYNSSVTSRDTKGHILDYDYINTYHPEWFLLKDTKDPRKADARNPDNRIRWAPNNKHSPYYNRFYIDVCNQDFQDWAVQQILYHVSGKANNLDHPYSGLAFDNVVLRRIKVRFNTPYPNWKYADDIERWKKGFLNYLRKVHKALAVRGYLLVVNSSFYWELEKNGSDLNDLMTVADGIMHEWAIGYGRDATGEKNRHWGGRKWLLFLGRHEAIVNRGLIDWWACYPSEEPKLGRKQFLYAYCSFLLIKRPGYSLFYSSSDEGLKRNRDVPWYDEYDLPIGQPISRRYFRDGCWFRDYTNARIVVNPEDVSRRVVVDKNKMWLDWITKKAVNELTLAPRSGRIFLATPYKVRTEIPDLKK